MKSENVMLINARHSEERRVAIVEHGVLQDLEVEYAGKGLSKGNIYKGVVNRIEPSIHALFIDYGGNKHGFLPFSEVHPICYGREGQREDTPKEERATIEQNMKPGQEVLVQIVKEERDQKGAYLTTYLSIAGRYLVLMPGSKKGGISRRIDDEKERAKLKEIITSLNPPEGMGVIIRTAGMGRSKADLKRDLNNLLRVWKGIKGRSKGQKAPSLIYQEGDLVIRSIRDYFSADISEIRVDDLDVYKQAKDFMKLMMPRYQGRVRLHKEKAPLFADFNLEEQIESIYGNQVPLKSGGSIVIDPTEALVAIDVNSGRSRGEKNIEETAFRTNSEAAEEIARQLRLRDLGGLIVVDFIDMRMKKHNSEVEKILKSGIKNDKAKIDVGRISKFGLLEMSRQRMRSSLIERSFVNCPHCGGSGTIKSVESNALFLLRRIHHASLAENVKKIDMLLPLEIANDLNNRKRTDLAKIEKDHNVIIEITGQSGIPVNTFNIEVVKSGKGPEPDERLKGRSSQKQKPKAKAKEKSPESGSGQKADSKSSEKAGEKGGKPSRRPRQRRSLQGRGRSQRKQEGEQKDSGTSPKIDTAPAAAAEKAKSPDAGGSDAEGSLLKRIRSAMKGKTEA